MRRFFVEKIPENGGSMLIKGQEAGHMIRVLRLSPGDPVVLMDAEGSRVQAVIESTGRSAVKVIIERPLKGPPKSMLRLTLCQALLKSKAMDDVVRRASELGVDQLLPFTSERTVPRLDQRQFAAKQKRWEEIVKNAAKQADRIKPMSIGSLSAFAELISAPFERGACRVILWESEKKRDLKGLLRSLPPSRYFVGFVGPEGGFSKNEVAAAGRKGISAFSLGHRVLKADTAALTLAALVQYEWGDLSLGFSVPYEKM